MSTKSNARLPPDGILSPSPCSFPKRLTEPSVRLTPQRRSSQMESQAHLRLFSYPINNLESSVRLISQRNLQMASVSPFPHRQPTTSANFQVYSSVQSSSTSRSRKEKHANLTLPVQED